MSSTQTITRNPLEHPSMDFAALRAEGIRLLERLASQTWTDFNAHDPGITLLEQVCYAITELGYRAGHDMPDLLAGSGDPYRSLYSPRTILHNEPVTVLDLRKLALDVVGVRDAWIEPIDAPSPALAYHEGKQELRLRKPGSKSTEDRYAVPVALRGLFRVLIAPSDLDDVNPVIIRRNVVRSLHAHRPLCADFTEVSVLQAEKIQVKARIEIASGPDPFQLLVAVYEAISTHIAPPVRFRTLAEMLAMGKEIDAIFSGPRLSRGFIDADELAARGRRTALHTSDILRELMDIPGVRAVHDIGLKSGAFPNSQVEPWTLVLQGDRVPQLDLSSSSITLVRDGIDLIVDIPAVVEEVKRQRSKKAAPSAQPVEALDRVPPPGRDRQVSRYTSILRQLPDCYGVGPIGLAPSAPAARRAQQKQLRAYLLFFDQLLCNAFAQLGQVPALFAFDGEGTRTYAAQAVDDDALGLDALRKRDKDAHAAWLRDFVDDPYGSRASRERALRFLDHLLARFAEKPTAYAPALDDEPSAEDAMARDKRAFLMAYPRISAARGTARDLTAPQGEANRPGLADRVERRLGFSAASGERLLVIEHILLRPMVEDLNQLGEGEISPIPILAASQMRDPYSMQLSVVLPSGPERLADPAFRKLVEQTVRDETPAHLTPYVHWLEQSAYDALAAAYGEWMTRYQDYWMEKLGV